MYCFFFVVVVFNIKNSTLFSQLSMANPPCWQVPINVNGVATFFVRTSTSCFLLSIHIVSISFTFCISRVDDISKPSVRHKICCVDCIV